MCKGLYSFAKQRINIYMPFVCEIYYTTSKVSLFTFFPFFFFNNLHRHDVIFFFFLYAYSKISLSLTILTRHCLQFYPMSKSIFLDLSSLSEIRNRSPSSSLRRMITRLFIHRCARETKAKRCNSWTRWRAIRSQENWHYSTESDLIVRAGEVTWFSFSPLCERILLLWCTQIGILIVSRLQVNIVQIRNGSIE